MGWLGYPGNFAQGKVIYRNTIADSLGAMHAFGQHWHGWMWHWRDKTKDTKFLERRAFSITGIVEFLAIQFNLCTRSTQKLLLRFPHILRNGSYTWTKKVLLSQVIKKKKIQLVTILRNMSRETVPCKEQPWFQPVSLIKLHDCGLICRFLTVWWYWKRYEMYYPLLMWKVNINVPALEL